MKCPTCGHDPEQNADAGRKRWEGVSKAQRKKLTSAAAKARWVKAKAAKKAD